MDTKTIYFTPVGDSRKRRKYLLNLGPPADPVYPALRPLCRTRIRACFAYPLGTVDLLPLTNAEAAAVRSPWRRPLLWAALALAAGAWLRLQPR